MAHLFLRAGWLWASWPTYQRLRPPNGEVARGHRGGDGWQPRLLMMVLRGPASFAPVRCIRWSSILGALDSRSTAFPPTKGLQDAVPPSPAPSRPPPRPTVRSRSTWGIPRDRRHRPPRHRHGQGWMSRYLRALRKDFRIRTPSRSRSDYCP